MDFDFDFDIEKPKNKTAPKAATPAHTPRQEVKTPTPPVTPAGGGLEDIMKIDSSDGRFYGIKRNGNIRYYPSVTTILKTYFNAQLARWRGDVGNQEADRIFYEAGEKGTFVHKAFEDLCKGVVLFYNSHPDYSTDRAYRVIEDQYAYMQLSRLVRFMEAVRPTIIAGEMTIVSDNHRYAGTLDLLLAIKEGVYRVNGKNPVHFSGGVYVADIKTSNSFHENQHWQTAAYAKALEEMGVINHVDGTLILHTKSSNRTGIEGFSAKLREDHEVEEDFQNFLKVQQVYNINAPEPQIYELPKSLSLSL